jgi:hypothetical protein
MIDMIRACTLCRLFFAWDSLQNPIYHTLIRVIRDFFRSSLFNPTLFVTFLHLLR